MSGASPNKRGWIMVRLLMVYLIGFVLVFISSLAIAENPEEAMYNYYTDLADIIERDMDNPDQCVEEIERYYQENQEDIEKMQEYTEESRRRGEGMQNRPVTEEEIEKAGEALSQTKMVEALNRFIEVLSNFSMEHPDHAKRIREVMEQFAPKYE